MKAAHWIAVAWLLLVPPCWAGEQATIDSGGQQRSYFVHVPAGLPAAAPVVFMLHGAGGNGKHAAETYGWIAKAEREKFVLLAPDAVPVFADRAVNFATNPRVWNDGSGRAGPNVGASDDVALIRALIAAMAAQHGIDKKRVYVAGFSSGASMAQRLGLDMANEIAAIAPSAGELMQKNANPPPRGMPVVYLLGDRDPLSPYDGGEVRYPWGGATANREPARQQPAHWARLNGCNPAPQESRLRENVRVSRWSGCRGGVEVLFYTIEGLGHHWPGAEPSANYLRIGGPYVDSFRGADVIWDFFQRWRLP